MPTPIIVIDRDELRSFLNAAIADALDANRRKMESSTQRVSLHRAARLVRVRTALVRDAVERGELPAVRRGRARWITLRDLDAWAETTGRSAIHTEGEADGA